MDRGKVFDILEVERDYQDGKWPQDAYLSESDWLVLLEEYVNKAKAVRMADIRQDVVIPGSNFKTLVAISAIAAAALENLEYHNLTEWRGVELP